MIDYGTKEYTRDSSREWLVMMRKEYTRDYSRDDAN